MTTQPAATSISAYSALFPKVLLLLSLFTLSGCVYLRLLQVQRQLKNFDDNFWLGGRPDLVIQFKKPTLLPKDVRFLIGADPLEKINDGPGKIWHYEFEMVRSSMTPTAPLDKLSLNLHMAGGKLEKIAVPESFMSLFPRNVLLETLRQAKDAEILKLQKIARRRVQLSPHTDAELPSRQKTLSLLGEPLEVANDEFGEVLIYRYRIVKDPNKVAIIARLTFSADDLLRRVFVTWDTSSVDAQFDRDWVLNENTQNP